jgi:hypothetical protein
MKMQGVLKKMSFAVLIGLAVATSGCGDGGTSVFAQGRTARSAESGSAVAFPQPGDAKQQTISSQE